MDPNRRVMNSSNFVVREAERIAVAEENALRFAEQEQRRLAKKAEEYARPPETLLPVLPTHCRPTVRPTVDSGADVSSAPAPPPSAAPPALYLGR